MKSPISLPRISHLLLALSLSGLGSISMAQTPMESNQTTAKSAHPTLALEGSASRQVPEDTAWAVFAVEREAKDQADAQQQAQAALKALMAQIKQAGSGLQVSTESTYTTPIYAPKTEKITAWRAHLSVRIESAETGLVAQTATGLMGKARLLGTGFYLSRSKRQAVERELIAEAVKAFEHKAQTTAKALGFASTSYHSVQLQQGHGGAMVAHAMAARGGAMDAQGESAEPLAMEPGRAEVAVTLSGTVNLLR